MQPFTNAEDWVQDVIFTDAETGDPIPSIDGAEAAEVELRDIDGEVVLSGTLADGTITLPGSGVVTWAFPRASLAVLEPGTHEVWVSVTLAGAKVDMFIDIVAVMAGV